LEGCFHSEKGTGEGQEREGRKKEEEKEQETRRKVVLPNARISGEKDRKGDNWTENSEEMLYEGEKLFTGGNPKKKEV